MGYDWILAFYPAIQAFLAGENPYGIGLRDFLNPPWVLPFLAPFGLLSPELGAWGINMVNLSGLVAFCRKAGRSWMALPLALSFPMGILLWHAQLEGFLLWGLVIGGPLGFLFLTFKPQVGGGIALLWLWQAWQAKGWRGVLALVWPTVALAIVFTLIYPNWINAMLSATSQGDAGAMGGFPWLVPLGIFLLARAFRTQREEFAASGMLFLSPYGRPHSWMVSLAIAACRYPQEGVIACAASWIVFALLM